MALSTKTLDALNDSRKTEPHKYIWGQFTPDKEGVGYADLPEQTIIPDDAKLVLDVNGPSLVKASVKDLKSGISESIATTEKAGIVKPDGTTISVSSDGTIVAEFTDALSGKVAKAGDTMSGQLVMENGSNGIRFNGATADNFYYVKAGNGGIYQYNKENQGSILSTPVGSLIMGPIPEAQTPAGYLFCNGQAVSRTTYSALFNVLGTNFGAGDGSTTFNVPDYRDCFLRGLGTKNNSFYVKQSQGLPDHSHKEFNTTYNTYGDQLTSVPDSFVAAAGIKRNTTDRDDYNLMVSVGNPVTPNAGNTGNASVSNSIYGASSEVRPVNYAVNYFIKY